MATIFTHVNVDLDAVCSVWFARNVMRHPGALAFKPANWGGSEAAEGDLVLDIDANGRGIKGAKGDNIVHSCFASLVEKYADDRTKKALEALVQFVDIQDSKGSVVKTLIPESTKETQDILGACGLNAVLRALQHVHKGNDREVVDAMSEVLDGLLGCGLNRIDAEGEADQAELVANGTLAIVRNSKYFATNGILFERGVQAIVFIDGNNLGCCRRNDVAVRMDGPSTWDVVKEAGEAGEWFAHPAGFLFARGTRKAPASEPSRVNPYKLALAVCKQLIE